MLNYRAQAMRYALPVVAFDAGGIKEWLLDGHTGFLVPWMERAKLAGRLEQLLKDKPLARKLGEGGFRFVSERFDFETYIGDLEKMFQAVIAQGRS